MEQVIKVVNSSWFKSLAIGIIGIALIAEGHPFYSGIAFGFAAREFLFSLRPTCDVCNK
tara:strand:+ start:81 stop:257 length:177 start_codon:yes stop_codon:yes gene_type:complete